MQIPGLNDFCQYVHEISFPSPAKWKKRGHNGWWTWAAHAFYSTAIIISWGCTAPQVGHLHRKWSTPVLSNAPCWTKAGANSKQMIWPISLGLVGDKPCYFWLLPKKVLSHTTGGHCPKDCLLSSHKPADLKQIHFNINKPHVWILGLKRKFATWKCPLTQSLRVTGQPRYLR